ncbi:MAG: hypothetical protein ACE5GX_20830, partial [Thermoanaerobaculia bacterium]
QPEFAFQFESAFGALAHFGIPFRVADLAMGSPTGELLYGCRAAIIFQEHIGARLGRAGTAALLRATEEGMGLVNFDSDLDGYGDEFLHAVGLKGAGRSGEVVTGGTQALHVRDNSHPITWWQDGDTRKILRGPVPTTLVRMRLPGGAVLLEDADGAPMLFGKPLGRGKVVQWLVSPKIWLRQHFGHTFGLDDVWLRSITWAARKPFVMKAMPPFVRFRFDDCRGLWRDAGDFAFVEVLNEARHVPSLCFCLRAVTAAGAAKVNELYRAGKAEFAPHTLAPSTSLFYGDDGGEYDPQRFVALFREMDQTLDRLGIRPSRILSDHDHSWSVHAIPGLVARGMTYKMNITMPGEPWEAVHHDWHPAPYGSMDYAFDFLPGPAKDFFVVYNHYPPAFESARTYVDQDHFLYHRTGGYGAYKWDILNSLTRGSVWAENQVKAAARRLADHTRLGLDAMFFGGSITHSHFIQHLTDGEWREILRGADALMPRHRYEGVAYDFIADYARSKVQTVILAAEEVGGDVTVELAGEALVPLRLYVFTDRDGAEHRFEYTGPFKGRATVRFATRRNS